jgi:ABC-type nitrate/sulfonate/bicarbonate transport system substrate-binding protein
MKLKLRLIVICAVLLCILACGKQQKDELRIGLISPSINHLPLSFALESAVEADEAFRITYFNSGWEVQEALIAGKLDAAIMPFSYVHNAAAKGYPVKIISFLERESDGIVARADVHSVAALHQRRIAVLKASTVELLLADLAQDIGIEYLPVYFRSPNEMLAALQRGEVDAVVAYVPVLQKLPAGFKVLHWFGDSHHHHPCCDLAVNEKQLTKSKSDRVIGLMERIGDILPQINMDNPLLIRYATTRYWISEDQLAEALAHTHFALGLDKAGKDFERRITEIAVEKGYQTRILRDHEIYLELK